MTTHSLPSPIRIVPSLTPPLWLLGGAAAAVADLALAALYWSGHGSTGLRVLQSIAAWALGPAAYQGGWASAAFGVLLYIGVLSAVMALYQRLSRYWPALVRRPVLFGAAYGVLMYWSIFHLFVRHFSAVIPRTVALPWEWEALCVAAYIGLIGVPCALLARMHWARTNS
ncbi:MAG TPA: hypothetical protein VN017_04880 [Pseudoxanthomonas sp.]|nr:hypothetical protein [Pseudoxanthomonas sp.]